MITAQHAHEHRMRAHARRFDRLTQQLAVLEAATPSTSEPGAEAPGQRRQEAA